MADLTLTAASVLAADSPTTKIQMVKFGATITQGMPLYLDSATMTWKIADANASQAAASAKGIALSAGSDGQWGLVMTEGDITIGATVAVGTIYVVSATAGKICPAGDLATGHYPCILGVAISTTVIRLKILAADVAIP